MRVRSDARRDAIVAVAAAAFAELGYERTSMSEISNRVGGSKATLYGYFPSKEALFVAATRQAAEREIAPAFAALRHSDDLAKELNTFAVRMITVFSRRETAAAQRMVIAQAAHSDIGRMFHASGPAEGMATLATYLDEAMRLGQMRAGNAVHAAQQLVALIDAETQQQRLFGLPVASPTQLRASARRGVDVFLRAYAAETDPSRGARAAT